ncbi:MULTISPECIES: AHH domain-containing protein [Corallococcus]|uniref:AHH domain-containing protein n=1 Tax=Corallococcus sp. CA031C TaxID=2316725 RepID=UPI0031345A76
MSLDDPANIVHVKGHKGPHPLAYHQRIFRRLDAATRNCRTLEQCREVLTAELDKLAQDIAAPGTILNRLVTGAWGRHNGPHAQALLRPERRHDHSRPVAARRPY